MDFTGYYSLILKLVLLLGQRAIISSTASKTLRNASLTDLSKCKLTQFGTDYMGTTSTTVGGIRCQMWHTEKPVHKVSEAITDTDVPERSLQLARNYCRNPTKDPRGPWCYTMEPTLIDDECEVPLCNFGECRVSGTGSEYGGTHDTTSSGRNCKSWDKRLKLAVNKTEKFSNNRFSDLSRNKAKNFCRNPDSSSGGPWCWVDSENYNIVEREYCSIPFCDDKDCLVYSKNASVYSTLTSLNSTFGNISFWIKLWNPADEQIGQARLLFTNLQVPTSAEEIAEEWGAGVEIVVSNSGSGQQFPRTDDETDFEETPNILLGSKWTGLWVAWGGGFISVGYQGSTKPIFLDEFEKKNTISSLYPESFFQYGIMGTGVLWSMQLCEDTCEMHTTFGVEFLRVWPLLQSNNSHDLQFYVRASHKATIQLTQTPAVPFPCYLIVIGQHNSTMVMYQKEESALKEILLDLETKTILNFWAWHEFTISIFGMAIQMFWHRDYGREEVFSIEHHNVPSLRWFSIGSENTITHWTLFCAPTEADAVEPPWFPNCISSSLDSRYEGSQWTTENQIPCIPWTSDRIPKNDKPEDTFIDGSALKALNKCRNPTNDPAGPFCYTATRSGSSPVKKQYCPIRKCRSSGTANDYLGTISVTRSGRNCARWVSGYEQVAAPRKNISLGSLMARAFLSLKVKRENAFEDRILDIPSHQWDEIGLRMRLPRDAELPVTWKTPRHRRVRETHKQNGIHKLVKYAEILATRSESAEDDDDDDDDDFFKLKPATFPPKKSSKATSKASPGTTRHQEIRTTDKLHNYYPGTFQPYGFKEITTESPDDDADDFFKLKPATFPPKKSSKATSEPSPGTTRHQEIRTTDKLHNYYPGTFQPYGSEEIATESPDDDDDDFFKLKPATFPPKKSSKATSKPSPGTTRHQEIRTTDKLHNYYPGTFQPYGFKEITTESPDDDADDFFKLKPATFPPKKSSKATSEPSPGTTRHQEIRTTDKLHNYYPGTFQPYGSEEIATESPDDDDDDFFKLKPATFPPKKSSKATSKPSPGTTRHQEIRTTDKLHNYYPGTFQPYGFEEITTESPDDDDDDFFKLKPATFPPKKSSKATSKPSPGTTRHQEIRTTDKLHNYYPGTFQPYGFEEITTESPDDDDDDFFKLKPATFPPKKSSKATSKPSPGTTRHQEIRTTDKLHNYYPGTFQPYGSEEITTESPDDDDDDFFKLKPATFPPKKSSKATSEPSPGTTRHQEIRTTDKLHNYYPGTFQPYGSEEIATESPDDDDDDFFKLKPATFPPKKSSKATSKPSPGTTRHQEIRTTDKLHNYYPGTFQPYGFKEITTESPDDDADDFFKLKPATFPPKKSSKATSEPSPGTTRHQEIRTTDKLHNYYPGTFQPYGSEEIATESPDDDDDDFFKLKPATFPPKKSSKATSKPSPGTTRHQEIRTTDKLHNYYPGTFQPYGFEEITTESPDDDDDDFFKLKPATFPPKKSSKATSKPSPGTTRHQEIRTTDKLHNYYPGTFQPYGFEEITTESPDNDNDDFSKLKPATFPPKKNSKPTSKTTPGTTRHQETWETTSERPNDDDNLLNHHPGSFQPYEIIETTYISPAPRDVSTNDSSLTTSLSLFNSTLKNPTPEKFSHTTPPPQSTESSKTISTTKNNASTPIPKVDPRYLNDTLYPDQNVKNASNYCRNPSRNIAGTWCYTTDPDVPQDLCNIRDCEKPEECTFLVRGHGSGRRLYVLPEYRSEGLHFSLKEWEPDHPDSITFVILSEDDIQSRLILKVGAMNNEKVLLYYETKEKGIKLVKQKTLPHLLYLGRWTGFVLRMDRGEVKLYYEGAPYPLFEWKDPEPAKAFLPIYYYYSSEGGNSIGVAFNCDTKCHIEQTTTTRFSRILPISIWETEETPSPHKLVLMLRGEGVVLLPLLMLPTTPGYYALTIGEMGQWVFFIKNKLPAVHILHKQDANGPLFTSDTWTNITIMFHNTTIRVLRNNTEVFNYIHNSPLLFYLFSLSVDTGGWVTWAANCIPTDIDGAPLDGGWSEWGPWTCSASCNGGMGVRKRTCDNPEPNIRGQPCLGPSTMNGHCNMNKCGDVTDVTLALIKRRIQIQHKSIIIKEGDEATLSADTDIVSALRNETPTSEINWSRNGIFLEEEEDRVKLEDTTASISYSVVNDSGVYTQTLHRVDDSDLIFKIISLAVIPERNELVIRKSLPFSVTCNCVVLGYIYSDLKISWILNGKVFKDYGVSTPIAINVDHIPEANMSHHGEWRCEVVQSDLNFKWTTNVIKVRVLGPPNWLTHLMEDKLTRPIFGWMPSEGFVAFSAFFLTILIIVGIVSSTIWYIRFRESLKYKDLQKNDPIDSEESFNDSETEQLIVKNKKSK